MHDWLWPITCLVWRTRADYNPDLPTTNARSGCSKSRSTAISSSIGLTIGLALLVAGCTLSVESPPQSTLASPEPSRTTKSSERDPSSATEDEATGQTPSLPANQGRIGNPRVSGSQRRPAARCSASPRWHHLAHRATSGCTGPARSRDWRNGSNSAGKRLGTSWRDRRAGWRAMDHR